jgi:hypothetical protein
MHKTFEFVEANGHIHTAGCISLWPIATLFMSL